MSQQETRVQGYERSRADVSRLFGVADRLSVKIKTSRVRPPGYDISGTERCSRCSQVRDNCVDLKGVDGVIVNNAEHHDAPDEQRRRSVEDVRPVVDQEHDNRKAAS
uniref:Uncharacterized protein n=1 Tax=Diadromus pulchellus ascovirus 4a TaxID=158683 RepID=Q9DSU3_9VIRU|nr:hypothetical protein [Diadromus pulchellus ascovirus 4a]